MRHDQIEKLASLETPLAPAAGAGKDSHKGALLEMIIMGAGKTSVLTPLSVIKEG